VHVVTVRDRLAHAKVILSEFGSKYLMSSSSHFAELKEANSGGIGGRIWWRDLVEENGGGIGGRIGHRRGTYLGDTTIEFSPKQHFRNVRSEVMYTGVSACAHVNSSRLSSKSGSS
jgi:hypothetical protein